MNNKYYITENEKQRLRSIIGEKAAKLLEVFSDSGINCWLDSGSLLGIIRNNKLNDWEKDIDLGIFFDEYDRALKVSREFALQERVKFKLKFLRGLPYKLSFKFNGEKKKQLPFDIHIFFKIGDTAWSAQSSTLLKKGSNLPDAMFREFSEKHPAGRTKSKFSLYLSFAADYPLFAFCIFLKKTGLSIPVNIILKLNLGINILFNRNYINASSRIFRIFFKVFEWRIPLHFFESAGPIPGLPEHLLIPSPVEDYLSARYGDDWRLPREKWFYILDDGCIFPMDNASFRMAEKIYKISLKK